MNMIPAFQTMTSSTMALNAAASINSVQLVTQPVMQPALPATAQRFTSLVQGSAATNAAESVPLRPSIAEERPNDPVRDSGDSGDDGDSWLKKLLKLLKKIAKKISESKVFRLLKWLFKRPQFWIPALLAACDSNDHEKQSEPEESSNREGSTNRMVVNGGRHAGIENC